MKVRTHRLGMGVALAAAAALAMATGSGAGGLLADAPGDGQGAVIDSLFLYPTNENAPAGAAEGSQAAPASQPDVPTPDPGATEGS